MPISVRLFKCLGLFIFFRISNFSPKHKWQVFMPGLNFGHFLIIFHLMLGLGLRFSCHTLVDKVVLFFL